MTQECPTCGASQDYVGVCHACFLRFSGGDPWPESMRKAVRAFFYVDRLAGEEEPVAFKPYCRTCGHLGQGAKTLTGAVNCARRHTFVHEGDLACGSYVKVGTLEGNLAKLGEALTWTASAVASLNGSNVGTVTDPRFPMPEPTKKRGKRNV